MFEHEGMIYSSPPCRISYEMGLKAQQLPKFPFEFDASEMSEINRDLLRLILLHSHLISKLSDGIKKGLFKELKELIINRR